MSAHHIQILQQSDGRWHGFCSCRAASDYLPARWRVEDWKDRHERLVEQARSHLTKTQPSLKATHDYYVQMSQDTGVPAEQREQWALLAEGLRPRIRLTEPDDPALFDVKPLMRQPDRKGSQ